VKQPSDRFKIQWLVHVVGLIENMRNGL
jgi:hypothetical protein